MIPNLSFLSLVYIVAKFTKTQRVWPTADNTNDIE